MFNQWELLQLVREFVGSDFLNDLTNKFLDISSFFYIFYIQEGIMKNVNLLVVFSILSLISCKQNRSPATPNSPFGISGGMADEELSYGASTTDPDGDEIAYGFDWGDGSDLTLSDYYPSGDSAFESHTYTTRGTYEIIVRAEDPEGYSSDWSSTLTVTIDTVPFYVFISSDTIQTEEEIYDILIERDSCLLLTVDGDILEVLDNGETSVFDTNNIKGFYEMKVKGTLPLDYDFEYYSHFCESDNFYYACYSDGSFSSRIVRIDPMTGDEAFFRYLTGIPSGMIYKDGTLWYLSNRGEGSSGMTSIIRNYDGITGAPLLSMTEISVLDAKGLSINTNGIITTYENESHSFVSFRIIY